MQKAKNSDEIAVYEDFVQLPAQEKWFLSTFTKIENANNEILGIQIISQDITALKQSKVALQESEEKFSSAFYDSPIPLMMLDYETGIRFAVNDQFVDVFGYTREELIGNSFLEKTIAVDLAQVQNSIDLIRENSFFRNLPFDMLTKSGEIRQVLVSSARINSEHGNLFMNSYLDITELKQAEKALQKSTQLLEASQSIAKVGGWELDIATNKLFWTAETYHIHDTSPEEFNPTVNAGVSYFLPESRRIISAALEVAIERGQGYDLVLETLTTKGRQITVRTTCEVTFNEGRPAKLTGIFQDITEQKLAEKALRERNQELARLYRTSDTFMAMSFPGIEPLAQTIVEAMLHEFSQTNCSLVLVEPDTPILNRMAVAGPFANEVRNQMLRLDGSGLIARAIRSGEVLNVADVQSDPDYLSIWPETRAELVIPLKIDDQIIGAIAIQSPQLAAFGDDDVRLMVTFADRAAVALQNAQLRIQSEQVAAFNKSIIQSMAEGIIVENDDGIITFVNPAAAALLGYAEDELTGVARTKFIPNDAHHRPDTDNKNSQDRKTQPYELRIPRQDGHLITLQIRETPRFVMDEFIDNMLVFSDITSRRATEEEKDRLLQQIQAQTTYLAQILNAVPEGVVLFDSVGHVLLANPTGERDLALLSQHQSGEPVTHLGERPFTNFLYPSQKKGMWHEAQANNRVYEIIARPVETGNEQRWVMVLNDVTQQREYQYYQQSQNQLASVGQLAAGIAHDFNNIMGVISIYAEMLQATPGLPVTAHSKLETIHKQTQHAVALIKQILDFSRRSLLEPLPVDLVIMVKEVVKLLERTLPENIHLQLVYDQKDYVIFGDPTSLQQLLMNLSVNARDAMPAGGTLTFDLNDLQIEADDDISVAMMKPGHWLRLSVTDTGEGITTEHQARIFDPFFTTKQPDKGTGLGLAQVYGIVQQHNGEITVDSKLGEGTTFTLYFPLLDKEALVTSEKPGVDNVPAGKEAILLVEDNEAMRLAVAAVLVQLNYDVFTAANGEEALQLLESLEGQEIDMVITDLVMPGMSGKELAETLLQRFDLKILIITGHPLDQYEGFSQNMPAISWMSKPFSQSALATRIRSLFDETG
jgi:PAS domain S-box-containing protein